MLELIILKGVIDIIHLGTKTFETDRLLLRKFKLSDAEDMYRNWASDDDVTKFITWPTHSSIEVTKNVISSWINEYNKENNYQWCIVLKETNEAIGSIGVPRMSEDLEIVEIGYCIGKEYWNKGIVSEAFSAIINYFFGEVKVKRIEARHDINNPASGIVMKKCGLQFEGILRQAGKNNTGICDLAVYAILRDYWNNTTSSK